MIRPMRAGLALAAAFSLFSAAAQAAPPLAHPPLAKGQWPQAVSDLKPDPDVRFGALPNGMRYAIRKQAIPPGQAAIRLWIDAGSLQETDKQQGLAHFLEHMAFNGSKGVAKEFEMVRILERLGLAFGADTNASTDFAETIYKLDLPKTDAETVDTSLMLMREAAGNLTIDAKAVDHERGVILSEERSSDTPAYRTYRARLGFLMPGQRLPTRYPIGQVQVLKTAPAAEIVDFYHRYYRPERAVLVVVGDFDADAMEAKIRAKFSDWQAVGPAGTDPDLGKVMPRKPQAKLVVESGLPFSLQISWLRAPDLDPDTVAERREQIVERLAFAVLNRRLSAIARQPDPPFIAAGAFAGDQYRSVRITSVGVNAEAGRWKQALAAVEQEQRRAASYGVRQDELDREIEEMRTLYTAAVAGAATRRPSDLAGEIVGALGEDGVVTSPAQEAALFEETVKGLTAQTASAALKAAFTGEGPVMFAASPQPIEGAEQTLLAALTASQKVAVAPPAAPSQVAWPYASFGAPGKIAASRDVADLDTRFVRFANGVRLTIKPTKFRDDQVLVRVNVGEGLLDLPRDAENMEWIAGALIEGGLKKIDSEDMERVLASKYYGANFGVNDDGFVLVGSTRTGDLPTQLQVLTAYLSDPGWRPEAFARAKAARATAHDQLEATTGGVVSRDLAALLHPGDNRFVFPSRQAIAGATLDQLKSQIGPLLANGAVDVVIVGDTTLEAATAAVAATFGALPPRPDPKTIPASARRMAFPAGNAKPTVLTHKGRADQAVGYIAWKTSDYWDNPQRARETAILGEVMRLRLTEELRETQGATYSPNAGSNHSLVWTGWGYLAANVEVPPEKLPEFFSDVQKIAADLRTKEITADELARAKKPRIEGLERARRTNQFWLAQLAGAQDDPRRLDIIREQIAGVEKVTAADVKRAAETFLKDDAAFKLAVTPETKATAKATAATTAAAAR